MIPSSYALLASFLVFPTLVAALVGLGSAVVVSLLLRRPPESIALRGGAFGAGTFLLVFVLSSVTPVPRNTVITYLPGGTKLTSTMNRFQHPIALSYATAALVSGALALWRSRRQV